MPAKPESGSIPEGPSVSPSPSLPSAGKSMVQTPQRDPSSWVLLIKTAAADTNKRQNLGKRGGHKGQRHRISMPPISRLNDRKSPPPQALCTLRFSLHSRSVFSPTALQAAENGSGVRTVFPHIGSPRRGNLKITVADWARLDESRSWRVLSCAYFRHPSSFHRFTLALQELYGPCCKQSPLVSFPLLGNTIGR